MGKKSKYFCFIKIFGIFILSIFIFACTETKIVEIEKPVIVNNPEDQEDAPNTPVTVEGGGAVFNQDIIGPKFVTGNPANGYQEVSPSTAINLTFSEDLDPASVTSSNIQIKDSGGSVIEGTLSYKSDTKTASFVPAAPLLDSEQYTIVITTGIRDPAGNEKPVDDFITFRVTDLKTIAIALGTYHMVALKENKTVWAWGRNQAGQLGDGTNTDKNHPVRVKELNNVSAIVASNNNSYALIEGSVWAWGANESGQLGDGTTNNNSTPMKIPNLENVIAIAGSGSAGYALKNDGTVWAWGSNRRGLLGDGTGTGDNSDHNSFVPVRVLIDDPVIKMSGGANFAMALTQDPTTQETSVWTWGAGAQGQLGNNTTPGTAPKPVQVFNSSGSEKLHGIKEISASGARAMALSQDGKVFAWGHNTYGQVGNGSYSNIPLPIEINGIGTTERLFNGGAFSQSSFTNDANGHVWGWGNNSTSQLLFYSASGKESTPKFITGVASVSDVQANQDSVAYLLTDGSVLTAGLNIHGQLGHGTASYYNYNPNLTNFPHAKQVNGRLILAKDGTVWAMGRNVDCELGLPKHGSELMQPVQIAIPTKITQVANSGMHMLALDENKNVWAWGSNAHGQLGNGSTGGTSCIPEKVKSSDGTTVLDNIESIAAGLNIEINNAFMFGTSMAIRKIPGDPNGATEVVAWGSNYNGQLGIATSTANSALPVKVNGLPSNIAQLSLSTNVMAVTIDGLVYGWGRNSSGQLCTGTTVGGYQPQKTLVSNAKQVTAAGLFSLILLNDGTVKSCGNNFRGQLGIGWASVLSADSTLAVETVQNLSNVTSVSAAAYTSMAITADGQLWSWGNNLWGQLGTGNSLNQNVPVKVLIKNGTPFTDITQASIYIADNTGDTSTVITAIRNNGSVWDWGYLRTPFSYLIREGESAVNSAQIVNWP